MNDWNIGHDTAKELVICLDIQDTKLCVMMDSK